MDGLDFLGDVAGEVLVTGAMSNDDKEKRGCAIFFIVLLLIIGGVILYYSYSDEKVDNNIKGVVLYKMSDNRLLIKTNEGEKIYTVTQELYTNKNVNDSIILKKVE